MRSARCIVTKCVVDFLDIEYLFQNCPFYFIQVQYFFLLVCVKRNIFSPFEWQKSFAFYALEHTGPWRVRMSHHWWWMPFMDFRVMTILDFFCVTDLNRYIFTFNWSELSLIFMPNYTDRLKALQFSPFAYIHSVI